MATVVLDRVSAVYRAETVLKRVSVEVADGSVLGIIGPSGSGKSTLLRVVAGLTEPSEGRVIFDGVDVTGSTTADRNIGMVFQENAIYPGRTVRRNVSFPLEIRRLPGDEINQRVEAEARVLEIERLLERMPGKLSAGYQQLTQAARALVRAPQVFLMDEPLARLDARLKTMMRHELMLLQQGYGVTMLYATNDQTEAMALADRVLVLEAGEVRQLGAPLDLYHRPADRFVAGFVGTPAMRFLRGSVERDGAGFVLRLLGRNWRVWDPGLDAMVGRSVVVGIRPEYFELVDSGGLRGTVVGHEYTGDFGWCSVRIGGDEVLVRIEGTLPDDGSEVAVAFTAFHAFNEAGRAVAHVRLPGPAQAV